MEFRGISLKSWFSARLSIGFARHGGLARPAADALGSLRGRSLVDPGQSGAVPVEVNEGKARAQPLVILLQAAVAHLGKAEDALQHAEGPLDFCSHASFRAVLALLRFIHARLGFPLLLVMSCAGGAAL